MWTAEFTVEFTPLPPEMQAAYLATVLYFIEVMFENELTAPALELEAVNGRRSSGVLPA